MKPLKIYIKNMCCSRCIGEVKNLLAKSGIVPLKVTLGEVHLKPELSNKHREELTRQLSTQGFSIADSNDDKLIVKIKSALIQYLNDVITKGKKIQMSEYVTDAVHLSYYHLSRIFSSRTGSTIERYFITLRIEKAKEFVTQNEMTFSEIASLLGYSVPQTFYTQFKKETGKTPGEYKLNPLPLRIHLDLLPQNFKQRSGITKHKV